MFLNDVLDLREASEEYDININTLKTACQKGSSGLKENVDFKKAGRVWLITRQAIERVWRGIESEPKILREAAFNLQQYCFFLKEYLKKELKDSIKYIDCCIYNLEYNTGNSELKINYTIEDFNEAILQFNVVRSIHRLIDEEEDLYRIELKKEIKEMIKKRKSTDHIKLLNVEEKDDD